MSIPVEQEEPWFDNCLENCVICRTPSGWWTRFPDRKPGEQVAICLSCADKAQPGDIPTKAGWCHKERSLVRG